MSVASSYRSFEEFVAIILKRKTFVQNVEDHDATSQPVRPASSTLPPCYESSVRLTKQAAIIFIHNINPCVSVMERHLLFGDAGI